MINQGTYVHKERSLLKEKRRAKSHLQGMDTLPDKNVSNQDSTHMTAFSRTQNSAGQRDTCSNKLRTHSLDLGVYVNIEINFEDSRVSTELEETIDGKENCQNDSSKINPKPEVQINNGPAVGLNGSVSAVIPEVDNTKAVRPLSVLVSPPPLPPKCYRRSPGFEKSSCQGLEMKASNGPAVGLNGSVSAVIPEVDNTKPVRPLSVLVSPPPLPPKRYRRSPGCEKSSCQGPEMKASNEQNKPLNSLICQMSPVLGGDKGDDQCSDIDTQKIPDIHNSCTKVETKCSPQPSPKPPHKPPRKPPRLNKLKRAEMEEQQQRRIHEAEWTKHGDKMGYKRNKQEQYLTDRDENTEGNTEASRMGGDLGVGKPPTQILVIFTDMEKGGEDRLDRVMEDEDPTNIELTNLKIMENSSLLPQVEKLTAINGKCTFADSTKTELKIPAQPLAKPHRKCCPVPPVKPPQLFSAMKAGIEAEKERRKHEEGPWRHEDMLDKGKDEGEGNDRQKVNEDPGDTKLITPTSTLMSSKLEELPRGGVRFCLMPNCRNCPMPVNTPENQTLHLQSQLPGTQHQNKANRQFNPVPLLREVPAQVNPMETDLNMEALKWTENKVIQMSGQVIAKMSPGHPEGTEVFRAEPDPCQLGLQRLENPQEMGEKHLDGEFKYTNQKPTARIRVKNLAKKVMCKLKEGREEKIRIKAGQVTQGDPEVTQDARRHWEEGGMKEAEEEGMDEDGVGQSALTPLGIKRRHATSESPFSSFKMCSPVKLVAELLSGDEWSQFLYTEQSSTADSPPDQTQAGDRAHHSVNFKVQSSAELDLTVSEGKPAVPEEETIYENIDLSDVKTEEQQELDRALGTAMPQILVESDANLMSPRIKDIYNTVEVIQPVQSSNTCLNLSEIKAVLDTSVQRYLIKLSKKRKHKVRKQRRDRNQVNFSQSPSSTSPQQYFTTSVFYKVPAAGAEEEQQLSTIKSEGHSPKIVQL